MKTGADALATEGSPAGRAAGGWFAVARPWRSTKAGADSPATENALAERAAGGWLLVAAVVVLLPHVPRFPLWFNAALVLIFGWRFFILTRGWPAPNRWLSYSLTLLLAAALFLQHRTFLGRDAGSDLLALMFALKLLELQRLRDYTVSVLILYFLILIGFLFAQSFWLVMYLGTVLVLTTATLVRLTVPGAKTRFALKLAGVLLLQALPLMVVMYFLFPRAQGALWGVPAGGGASTGLSETMYPGSINDLSLTSDVAFRAYFSDELPPPAQRYWRALVLWETDGQGWSRGADPRADLSIQGLAPLLRYALVLEPVEKPWLPALDLPAAFPDSVRRRAGFVLETRRLPRAFQRFELAAYTRYRAGLLTDAERRATLQLPPTIRPRVRALADEWRREKRTDAAIVGAALDYFRTQSFYYTLRPPAYENDPVDEFLFDVRRGFCEHYASAFVTLMRVAGIPSRIVTGYQGGEANRAEKYLIVRQSDAHAWAEVWLPERGWVRVDPTAAIAPERIEYGAEALQRLVQQGAALGRMQPGEIQAALARNWFGESWQMARLTLDSSLTAWQRWVLNYDFSRQQELLARLGLENIAMSRLVGLLALVVALLFGIYVLTTLPRGVHLDPVQRAWLAFCRKLARAGVARLPHEGALDFAKRVARERPDLALDTRNIADLYQRIRYAGDDAVVLRAQLAGMIKTFRA